MESTATMDVKTAAKYIGIGKNAMYDLARSESFPTIRIGKRFVIPVKALDEWLVKNAQNKAEF